MRKQDADSRSALGLETKSVAPFMNLPDKSHQDHLSQSSDFIVVVILQTFDRGAITSLYAFSSREFRMIDKSSCEMIDARCRMHSANCSFGKLPTCKMRDITSEWSWDLVNISYFFRRLA